MANVQLTARPQRATHTPLLVRGLTQQFKPHDFENYSHLNAQVFFALLLTPQPKF